MRIPRILTRAVLLIALFAAGILLFNFVLMPALIHQRGAVIVPDLRSVTEAQAEKVLKRMSLKMRVARSEHHSEVPAGQVISHSPKVNESIKEGRTIEVVVSLGARTQLVPELKGLSLRQTRAMLSRSRLRIGRISRVAVIGDAGEEVVATSPSVGTELVEGSAVNLVVSVGGRKKEFVMPDLTGQDLLFIREKLREMGFRIGSVRYESREGVYPNTVIDQTPLSGALIREGDSIELVAASSD